MKQINQYLGNKLPLTPLCRNHDLLHLGSFHTNQTHYIKLYTFAPGIVSTQRHQINILFLEKCGTSSELMDSMLDSRSSGPGSSPSRVTVLCSWARHFTVIVSLFTQTYKWVSGSSMLG